MSRKPTDVVQLKLRIREDLRRRLERAAKSRGVSLNFEMAQRLTESFDRDALLTLSEIAAAIESKWPKRRKERADT